MDIRMRGSRKFCQRGSNFENVFLVDEGCDEPNTTISGPSSARQRNADPPMIKHIIYICFNMRGYYNHLAIVFVHVLAHLSSSSARQFTIDLNDIFS